MRGPISVPSHPPTEESRKMLEMGLNFPSRAALAEAFSVNEVQKTKCVCICGCAQRHIHTQTYMYSYAYMHILIRVYICTHM